MSIDNIEDIYNLSPLQEGLLFQTQYEQTPWVYLQQLKLKLGGLLDVTIFGRAWQLVIDHNPSLRASFEWQDVERPLQIIHRRVELPFRFEDLRHLSRAQQERQINDDADADRRLEFDLGVPPLMRLLLLRLAKDEYTLIWSYHHILMDGWSLPLILADAFSCYQCLALGQPWRPEPRQPFSDYIGWLQQQDKVKAQRFWRQTLSGFTTPTPLPLERFRESSEVAQEQYAVEQVSLSVETTAALQRLARQYRTTLNTIIQGAWGLLLSFYGGSDDVVYGTTVSGRPAELRGVESMVGLLINTLPVRLKIDRGQLLSSWLRDLQRCQVELSQYEYCGLVEIQRWSEMAPGTPLFESLLVFENYPVPASSGQKNDGIRIQSMDFFEQGSYPLTVSAGLVSSLMLRLTWNSLRFEAHGIKQLLRHYVSLLEQIVANQQGTISKISLLSEEERHQLLNEWSQGEEVCVEERTVKELFEQQVEERGDAIAIVWESEQVTYRELNRRANRLAHRLRRLGEGVEDAVGLWMERSPGLLVGMVGIVKAGCGYVGFEEGAPAERMRMMIEEAGIRVMVVSEGREEQVEGVVEVVRLGLGGELEGEEEESDPEVEKRGENLIYISYTSGTSGRPKGVVVKDQGVVRLVKESRYAELGEEQSILQAAPVSFDASSFEVWGALLGGGKSVLYGAGVPSASGLGRVIREGGVRTMWLTASLFNTVVDEEVKELRGVEQLLVGGEALSVRHVRRVKEEVEGVRLINGYGPTESTTFACTHEIEEEERERSIAIGRPIGQTEAYVMDGAGELSAMGAMGELYLGGRGLARCYQGDARQTAEKFVPHPYSKRGGEVVYRSGDLVRYREGGELEYVGRVDKQLKVRGYRVEPGEIEEVLKGCEGVREVVVEGRREEGEGVRLVAYVMSEGGSAREWRKYLRERLPEYLVPGVYVRMEELPLTASGKIDRQRLPEPQREFDELMSSLSPVAPVQQALSEIWSDVLKVERINSDDNFFDLGGHSLLATQVISRINQVFQLSLPLRRLFEIPKISALALEIEKARGEGKANNPPPVMPVSRDQELPLSFAQQRFWFTDRLRRESKIHHIPAGVRFVGKMSLTALEQTFSEIIRRHEVLRTSIGIGQKQAVQVIHPPQRLTIPLIDFEALDPADREAVRQRLSTEQMERSFDLTTGPLLRLAVIRSNAEKHELLMTSHHIVTDAWSTGLLVRELMVSYKAFGAGVPSPLPELELQYADFAAWQRQWFQGEALNEQLAYWERKLAAAPEVLDLVVNRRRASGKKAGYANKSFFLPRSLSDALTTLSRREGVTLFMTLLAAYKALLYRYTGQELICIGSPIANRHRPEIEGLLGCFVNMLVLCTDLSGDPEFRELLSRVREVTLEAYDHQDTPFEMVVDRLQPERVLSRTPLVQTTFTFQNTPLVTLELPHVAISPLSIAPGEVEFEMSVIVHSGMGEIGGLVIYNADLFTTSDVDQMLNHLQMILEQAVIRPECRLRELQLEIGAKTRRSGTALKIRGELAAEQFRF